MIDAAIYQLINNLRAMAMQVVEEADLVILRLNTPDGSPSGSLKKEGLTDSQRAKLLRTRRANVQKSLLRNNNKTKK